MTQRRIRPQSMWLAPLAAATGLLVAGCGGIQRDIEKPHSMALAKVPESGIAGRIEAAARSHPGKSGFALLKENREAYTDRIALADFARKTIDVQYYIWSNDTIGLMLADHLIRAADRGVRVRVLLDDENFRKRDSATASLAAHRNIQVRVFNPHHLRSMRLFEFATDFKRLNRRMHNKLMVMDNACAIVGGRNIADHYFGLGEDYNYRDLDVAAVGPVVRDISATFDEFWNSEAAVPLRAFLPKDPNLDEMRRQIVELRSSIRPERYPFPLEQDVASLRRRIDGVFDRISWAHGEVLHDTMGAWRGDSPGGLMKSRLFAEVAKARHSVKAEAAYFVLREPGISTIRSLTSRGVSVRVLTNSLAGNDVIVAQAGQTRKRPEVIAAGAKMHELRPDASAVLSQVAPQSRHARASLHTKALLIDDDTFFVGSYNLDPRSANINSEIGLLIHDRKIASKLNTFFDEGARPENSYQVTLDYRGRPVWQTVVNGQIQTWTHDPETSFTRRLMNEVCSWLPIENQL